jgi:hypothetical protein
MSAGNLVTIACAKCDHSAELRLSHKQSLVDRQELKFRCNDCGGGGRLVPGAKPSRTQPDPTHLDFQSEGRVTCPGDGTGEARRVPDATAAMLQQVFTSSRAIWLNKTLTRQRRVGTCDSMTDHIANCANYNRSTGGTCSCLEAAVVARQYVARIFEHSSIQ